MAVIEKLWLHISLWTHFRCILKLEIILRFWSIWFFFIVIWFESPTLWMQHSCALVIKMELLYTVWCISNGWETRLFHPLEKGILHVYVVDIRINDKKYSTHGALERWTFFFPLLTSIKLLTGGAEAPPFQAKGTSNKTKQVRRTWILILLNSPSLIPVLSKSFFLICFPKILK